MTTHFAEHAWLDGGWQSRLGFDLDHNGRFSNAQPEAEGAQAEHTGRWLLRGLPNLHSHAFQRAMAGMAERQTNPADSFWTWREVMYGFAARFSPDTLRNVAAMLYAEMLEAGYTSVCEFHYLHHAPDATPYADPAQMSLALIEAASDAGIALTLLPTLYMQGGFDGRALSERQRRFGHDVDSYLRLLEQLAPMQHDCLRIGACFHSLRAVPEDAMRLVLDALPDPTMPVHIHIAEQIGEVQDSLALRNARPVEWLLDNMPVDARWTLVHATHMTEVETRALAASGATVAICPTTEANLGDGLFPLRSYLDAGGSFGIGSDSHISISPVEELRWLEYGQRLGAHRRNIAVQPTRQSVGECLYAEALAGGTRGTGQAARDADLAARDTPRAPRADFLILDRDAPELAGATPHDLLDRWIFSGNRNLIRETWVAGTRKVEQGRHVKRDRLQTRYARAIDTLLESD